jgi:hypothetical protein
MLVLFDQLLCLSKFALKLGCFGVIEKLKLTLNLEENCVQPSRQR